MSIPPSSKISSDQFNSESLSGDGPLNNTVLEKIIKLQESDRSSIRPSVSVDNVFLTRLHAASDNTSAETSLKAGIAKATSFLEELNLWNPERKRLLEGYMENHQDSKSLKRLHAGLHLLIYLAAENKGIPEPSESSSSVALLTQSERKLLLEEKIDAFLLKLTTDYHLQGREEYSPRHDPILQAISRHHKYGIQPYAIQSYISLAELMLQKKREDNKSADPASLLTLAWQDCRSEHEAYMDKTTEYLYRPENLPNLRKTITDYMAKSGEKVIRN
jgi:hypothetical protein